MRLPESPIAHVRVLTARRSAALLASLCASVLLHAQTAPAPAPSAAAADASDTASVPSTSQSPGNADATIKLNPFEVDATQEKGYFSPTTLAGTRLNSNIADLPSSITVITKQQLVDTGALNINDVFMYEANVEGSRSYTVAQVDRNGVHDVLAGYDNGQGGANGSTTGANVNSTRVRGLGVPDIEVNNFYSVNRAPFDSYNVDSIQIERGPNSIIFGSGSPAGITNSSWTQAKIDKTFGNVSLEASSWNGFRQTADINIPLWKGKAALYLAQEYTSVGFQRRPAADLTRRQYAALTVDPFKNHKTHLTASAENYNNYANEENSLTPTDYITPWLQSGRPVYNALTSTVTYLSTGRTVGPYALSTTDSNYVPGGAIQANLNNSASPFFVPSLTFPSQRPIFFYDGTAFQYAYLPQQNGLVGSTGTAFFAPGAQNGGAAVYSPAQELVHAQRMTNSTNLPVPANIASSSWSYPGINNRSIYNYLSGPNIDAPNFSNTKIHTYNVEITQEILPNLNADLGFFRQEVQQTTQQFVGQVSPVSITIDTNALLPTGQANPYVGQPFEQDSQADVFRRPETNTNWRASLEYSLDFHNKVPVWLDWLGHHRFMTVYSKHDDWNETDRYRAEIIGGEPGYQPTNAFVSTVPANNWSYASNGSGYARWYYLGSPGGSGASISKAGGKLGNAGFGGQTSATINTYNYTANAWQSAPVTLGSELFFAGTPGDTQNIQDQKTYFWQSFFWNDRIVGTVGANHDQVSNRQTIFPANQYQEYIGGYAQPSVNQQYSPYQYVGGNTTTEGVVVRPFSHWGWIDDAAVKGNVLAGFIRTIGFTFNKANNFNPPSGFQTDYFGAPLGKPTGNEKDYGIEISTPDNRLYAKLTWFKGTNENAPFTPVEAARVLYTDVTQLHDWAVEVTQIRDHISDPATDPNFGNTTVYPVGAAQQAEIAQLTGLPYTYTFGQSPTGGLATGSNTTTATAKGADLEIVYNPLPNWTIKVTGGKQKSGNSSVEPQAQAYVAYRLKGDPTAKGFNPNGLPAWTGYTASDLPNVITKKDGTPLYLGNFWNGYGYDGNVPYNGTNGGPTTSSLYYQNVVGSVIAATTSSVGAAVPNEHEYSGSMLTNYMFDRGPLKNFSMGTGLTWQDHAIVGYYGSTDPTKLNSAGQIVQPDLKRPIYTPAEFHVDAWVAYGFKMPWSNGKLKMKVQFNVRDLTSHGYLLPVTYNFDGTPGAYRIISPRQYVLNTTVSF
jgi:outer membrane receptor protein involved in Fe transport